MIIVLNIAAFVFIIMVAFTVAEIIWPRVRWLNRFSLRGPKGDMGMTGPAGMTGEAGPRGATGAAGRNRKI